MAKPRYTEVLQHEQVYQSNYNSKFQKMSKLLQTLEDYLRDTADENKTKLLLQSKSTS